jgi:hypothetical protein
VEEVPSTYLADVEVRWGRNFRHSTKIKRPPKKKFGRGAKNEKKPEKIGKKN